MSDYSDTSYWYKSLLSKNYELSYRLFFCGKNKKSLDFQLLSSHATPSSKLSPSLRVDPNIFALTIFVSPQAFTWLIRVLNSWGVVTSEKGKVLIKECQGMLTHRRSSLESLDSELTTSIESLWVSLWLKSYIVISQRFRLFLIFSMWSVERWNPIYDS